MSGHTKGHEKSVLHLRRLVASASAVADEMSHGLDCEEFDGEFMCECGLDELRKVLSGRAAPTTKGESGP